jgi:predicted MFS family arabinose efflux permease
MFQLISIYRNSFANLQRNIWILSIAMFINRSGSMVLLFTSLYLTNQLHFSIADAGVALSFYGIGSVLGSYAGGWLTDRKEFFHIMILSLVISGFLLLLLLVITSLFGLSILIFTYAFTADIFRPANSKAIAVYSAPENRTRSVSLVRLAVNLGFTVGPAAGGFIALYLGYKWLFVIDAITSLLAAAMLYFYLPRKYESPISKGENSSLNNRNESAYKDFKYLFFILLVAFYGVCFFQLFASIPQYFSSACRYSEATIGLLMAFNGFLVVLIEMPLVAALEKKRNYLNLILAGVLCIPLAFVILQFGNQLIIAAIAYILILTLSEILAMPFMMNYSLSRAPAERQGQYSALYSMAYGLANIFAPLLGLGIAHKFGFSVMFYFFIGLSFLAASGFWFLKKQDEKNFNSGS